MLAGFFTFLLVSAILAALGAPLWAAALIGYLFGSGISLDARRRKLVEERLVLERELEIAEMERLKAL